MALRGKFEFVFTAEALAVAAAAKSGYHQARKEFWEREYEAACNRAEREGFRVERHAVTGGERAQIVIDPTLAGRVSECWEKIQRHDRDKAEYDRWRRALELSAGDAPEAAFALDVDDVAFFGL